MGVSAPWVDFGPQPCLWSSLHLLLLLSRLDPGQVLFLAVPGDVAGPSHQPWSGSVGSCLGWQGTACPGLPLAPGTLPFGSGWPWPVQTRHRQFMGKVNLQGSGSKAVSACFTLRDNSVSVFEESSMLH